MIISQPPMAEIIFDDLVAGHWHRLPNGEPGETLRLQDMYDVALRFSGPLDIHGIGCHGWIRFENLKRPEVTADELINLFQREKTPSESSPDSDEELTE